MKRAAWLMAVLLCVGYCVHAASRKANAPGSEKDKRLSAEFTWYPVPKRPSEDVTGIKQTYELYEDGSIRLGLKDKEPEEYEWIPDRNGCDIDYWRGRWDFRWAGKGRLWGHNAKKQSRNGAWLVADSKEDWEAFRRMWYTRQGLRVPGEKTKKSENKRKTRDSTEDAKKGDGKRVLYDSIRHMAERRQDDDITDVRWDEYCETVRGAKIDWTGWVHDASQGWLGGYTTYVDMDRPEVHQSSYDVRFSVNEAIAKKLKPGQRIRMQGTIDDVMLFMGVDLTIQLKDVQINE